MQGGVPNPGPEVRYLRLAPSWTGWPLRFFFNLFLLGWVENFTFSICMFLIQILHSKKLLYAHFPIPQVE
jgi:hypothetical protein